MVDKPYYKFLGPLDPGNTNQICIDRENEVDIVIRGINMNNYWTILGSRQVGKTTFLNLIKQKYEQADYIYFDFETIYSSEKEFYQWLIHQFQEKIPNKRIKSRFIKSDSPAMSFFDFLINFKPQKEKKIILLFDEIDGLPFLNSFLHFWRKIYHDRVEKKELYRYTVVTTGSVELVKLAIGPNSPFNIANNLYLKDFSEEESKKIIEEPFDRLNIEIESKAKQKLISQISGHPQLLQHACHILVENTKPGEEISEKNVDEVIERLLRENSVLKTLKRDIVNDEPLKKLVHELLKEKKQKTFHPYNAYALLGAGAIKEKNSFCKIRNPIYERCINDILENPVKMPTIEKKEYHEPMKTKTDEKDQSMNSRHPQKERRRRKLKNIIKFSIATFGILSIVLVVAAISSENPLTIFLLIFGAGISASLTVGGLISLLPGEKNESSIKNN